MNSDSEEDNSTNFAPTVSTMANSGTNSLWQRLNASKTLLQPLLRKMIIVVLALSVVCLLLSMATYTEEVEEEVEEEKDERRHSRARRPDGIIHRYFTPVESYLRRQYLPSLVHRPKRRRTYKRVRNWFLEALARYYYMSGGGRGAALQLMLCTLVVVVYSRYAARKKLEESTYQASECSDSVEESTELEDSMTAKSSTSGVVTSLSLSASPIPTGLVRPLRSVVHDDPPLQYLPSTPVRRTSRPLRPSLPSPVLLRTTGSPTSMFIGNRIRPRADELPGRADNLLTLIPDAAQTLAKKSAGKLSPAAETENSSDSVYPASTSYASTSSNSRARRKR